MAKEIKETEMRKNYNVNILAVQRNDNYIIQDLPTPATNREICYSSKVCGRISYDWGEWRMIL